MGCVLVGVGGEEMNEDLKMLIFLWVEPNLPCVIVLNNPFISLPAVPYRMLNIFQGSSNNERANNCGAREGTTTTPVTTTTAEGQTTTSFTTTTSYIRLNKYIFHIMYIQL